MRVTSSWQTQPKISPTKMWPPISCSPTMMTDRRDSDRLRSPTSVTTMTTEERAREARTERERALRAELDRARLGEEY